MHNICINIFHYLCDILMEILKLENEDKKIVKLIKLVRKHIQTKCLNDVLLIKNTKKWVYQKVNDH